MSGNCKYRFLVGEAFERIGINLMGYFDKQKVGKKYWGRNRLFNKIYIN